MAIRSSDTYLGEAQLIWQGLFRSQTQLCALRYSVLHQTLQCDVAGLERRSGALLLAFAGAGGHPPHDCPCPCVLQLVEHRLHHIKFHQSQRLNVRTHVYTRIAITGGGTAATASPCECPTARSRRRRALCDRALCSSSSGVSLEWLYVFEYLGSTRNML